MKVLTTENQPAYHDKDHLLMPPKMEILLKMISCWGVLYNFCLGYVVSGVVVVFCLFGFL